MSVALCAIWLVNRPEHREQVRAALDSAKAAGFDRWVIGIDRKSDADAIEYVRSLVPDADVFPFTMEREDGVEDFASARNQTLPRVPKDCEWWGWMDRDDTIVMTIGKTVQEILSEIPRKDKTGRDIGVVFFDYDYAQDEYGNSTTDHRKGRLYRADLGWEWRWRVHEDCWPVGGDFGKDRAVVYRGKDLVWLHHIGDRPSAFERNMRILRKMLEEDPNEPRTWYYLGNQFFANHDWLKAAEAYDHYIGITGWAQEKWHALIYQGIAYQQLNMWDRAIKSYTDAMLLKEELADAYFGLGEVYTRLGEWEKGRYWGELGIDRVAKGGLPDNTVFFNANAYQFNPYLWLATCYENLGDIDLAISAYEQAAKARPDKDVLAEIERLKWTQSRERMIRNGLDLAAGLLRRNEPLKALHLLENLPAGASERDDYRTAKALIERETAHLSDDIAYRNALFDVEQADPDQSRLDWEARALRGVGRVLQVGIGSGKEGLYLAQRGIEVVGIDVNPMAVRDGNWAAVKAGLMGTKTVRIATDEEAKEEGIEPTLESPDMTGPYRCYVSDYRDIHEQIKGPFDAVLATDLIGQVPDPEGLLSALDELAPIVLLSTPDGTYQGAQKRAKDRVRSYSMRDLLAAVLRHGSVVDAHTVSGEAQDQIVVRYRPKVVQTGPRVVIYCGNTLQGWTPDSLHQGGIGGSETAVIRVAEELAERGYRVKVWAECEGIWNGVSYGYAQDFVPWECELFVSWRQVGPDASKYAKRRFIWSHDVWFGPATEEQLKGVTVLALSEWHAGFLREKYPTADIVATSNGIDPERFDKQVERIPHRLIYAQSPDRGLDALLRAFPDIRKDFPDAELHVFYGMDLARERIPSYVALVEDLAGQPGVTLHGRVDQERLAEEYLRSDALVYPALMPNGEPFTETFCISVVEAQAAGCMPFTPSWGALAQTNVKGYRCESIRYALRDLSEWFRLSPEVRERRRSECRQWAREQTWTKVVEQWIGLLEPEQAEAA